MLRSLILPFLIIYSIILTIYVLNKISKTKEEKRKRLLISVEHSKQKILKLEEDLRIQQMQVDSIVDNMSEQCVVFDKEGNYIMMNKAAREFFSELQVKRKEDYLSCIKYYDIDGNEIDTDMVPEKRVLMGETLSDLRLIVRCKKKEIYLKINGASTYDEKGELLFGTICSTNIAVQVGYEKKIACQNIQLETIINTISDMAILSITDNEGNFLPYSHSANHYFSENTFRVKIGETYQRDMYFNEDGSEIMQHCMPIHRVLAGEKITNFSYYTKTSEKEKHFLFSGSPVYDKIGELTNAVLFNIDITEQVLYKNLITVSESLRELNVFKDKLIAVFSHDIRNPMANMINLMTLLGEDEEYNENNREIYLAIKEQVNHTYKMIENLLDWISNQRDGLTYELFRFKLSDLVQGIIDTYSVQAAIKKIHILSDKHGDIQLYTDKSLIRMVLDNFITNAIKFTDFGGVITIRSYVTEEGAIISVQDTGKGMDEQQLKDIFNKRYTITTVGTAGERGYGIGLTICQEFISCIGGIISVDSSPEIGTTFYLSLPKRQ